VAGRNKVEVRILGKDYTLVGVESDEYIQKVGLYIDKKMNEVMRANNKLSTSMAAVLTAINVADDLFKVQENEQNQKKEIEQLREQMKRAKEENKQFFVENASLSSRSTNLQLELAKREAELNEVRNSIEKVGKFR
jgi:cell division protein ZapA